MASDRGWTIAPPPFLKIPTVFLPSITGPPSDPPSDHASTRLPTATTAAMSGPTESKKTFLSLGNLPPRQNPADVQKQVSPRTRALVGRSSSGGRAARWVAGTRAEKDELSRLGRRLSLLSERAMVEGRDELASAKARGMGEGDVLAHSRDRSSSAVRVRTYSSVHAVQSIPRGPGGRLRASERIRGGEEREGAGRRADAANLWKERGGRPGQLRRAQPRVTNRQTATRRDPTRTLTDWALQGR